MQGGTIPDIGSFIIPNLYTGSIIRQNLKESKGSFISASDTSHRVAGIFIGLFMRMNHPDIDPATAFPQFVLNYMNPWLGGVDARNLLIAAVGTGAGLALGISTIFTKDIYANYINKGADDKAPFDIPMGHCINSVPGTAFHNRK